MNIFVHILENALLNRMSPEMTSSTGNDRAVTKFNYQLENWFTPKVDDQTRRCICCNVHR